MTVTETRRVAITGLGLVSPAGIGVDESWKRVLAGETAVRHDPRLAAAGTSITVSARIPETLDLCERFGAKAVRRRDRYSLLASVAAQEAITQIGVRLPEDSAVVIGCGIGGMPTWEDGHGKHLGGSRISPLMMPKMLSNMAAGQIATDHSLHGPNLAVNTACASGTSALISAATLLLGGEATTAIAGGVEAALTPFTVEAFASMGALSSRNDHTASRPFDVARDGFVIGEGAGVVVLETEEQVRRRGGEVMAWLVGWGASADGHHPTAPDPRGAGAARAISAALRQGGIDPASVDYVNAHGTSTPLNDRAEARALHAALGAAAADIPVSSTRCCLVNRDGSVDLGCRGG